MKPRKELEAQLQWYQETYFELQGALAAGGYFHLVSIDGGKSWYNVQEVADSGKKAIIGIAFPSQLREIYYLLIFLGQNDMADLIKQSFAES